MKNLNIKSDKNTPAIFFNIEKGILIITGKSLPENAVSFYEKLNDALQIFINDYSHQFLNITCEFEYVNTSSSKTIFNLFKKAIDGLNNNLSIIWGYEEDDEDMLELGETFSEELGLEFIFRVFTCE